MHILLKVTMHIYILLVQTPLKHLRTRPHSGPVIVSARALQSSASNDALLQQMLKEKEVAILKLYVVRACALRKLMVWDLGQGPRPIKGRMVSLASFGCI